MEPPKPAAKPFKSGFKIKTGVTIQGVLNPVEKENNELTSEQLKNLPRTPFTKEDFQKFWTKYALKMKDLDRASFYSTLKAAKPTLGENFQVAATVNNAIQFREFEHEKGDLLDYLRSNLNNYGIQLTITQQEAQDSKKLFTPMEQFKELVKKNPQIATLKDKLDLDIDY